MSKYKEIKGFKVQTLASDTAASQLSTGSWASGGALNTARTWLAGAGIQTAAISFRWNSTRWNKWCFNRKLIMDQLHGQK